MLDYLLKYTLWPCCNLGNLKLTHNDLQFAAVKRKSVAEGCELVCNLLVQFNYWDKLTRGIISLQLAEGSKED